MVASLRRMLSVSGHGPDAVTFSSETGGVCVTVVYVMQSGHAGVAANTGV